MSGKGPRGGGIGSVSQIPPIRRAKEQLRGQKVQGFVVGSTWLTDRSAEQVGSTLRRDGSGQWKPVHPGPEDRSEKSILC